MEHVAASDIALIESWGYTRNEAIGLVIARAVTHERDVDEDRTARSLAGQQAYFDELRTICLAETA
jgi:hypothetical protein